MDVFCHLQGFQETTQVRRTDDDDVIYHGEHTAEHNPALDTYLQRLSTDLTLMTGGRDADMQSLSTDLTLKIGGLTVAADPAQSCWSAAMPLYLSTSTLPAKGRRLAPTTTSQNAVVRSATSDSKDVEWQGLTELQEVVSAPVDSFEDFFSDIDISSFFA